jgi:hypothetical protein
LSCVEKEINTNIITIILIFIIKLIDENCNVYIYNGFKMGMKNSGSTAVIQSKIIKKTCKFLKWVTQKM